MFAMQGLTVQRFEFVSRQLSGRYCCVSVGDCYVAAAFHEVPPVKKRMVIFTYCTRGGGRGEGVDFVAFVSRDLSTTWGKLT